MTFPATKSRPKILSTFLYCQVLQHPFNRSYQAQSCLTPVHLESSWKDQLSHPFSITSFPCWPPHKTEVFNPTFQGLPDFCLSVHLHRRISSHHHSVCSSPLFSGWHLLQKLMLAKNTHQTGAKSILLSFSKDRRPFFHGTQLRNCFPTFFQLLGPSCCPMLYSQCTDWIGGVVRRGRNDVCRHHVFTEYQPQQRSSSISTVPGHSDNKQTPTSMSSRQTAWPRLWMVNPSPAQHKFHSCSPPSLVPLKRMLLVFPTLSSTPTHLTGAAKAVTKLPGQLRTQSRPLHWCTQLLRGPLPGWVGVWILSAWGEEGKSWKQHQKVIHGFPGSTFLLRWLCSLSYPHSAERLKWVQRVRDIRADAGGREPAEPTWSTSPKRRKWKATTSHCNGNRRRGAGLLLGNTPCQFFNSMKD